MGVAVERAGAPAGETPPVLRRAYPIWKLEAAEDVINDEVGMLILVFASGL